VVGKHYMCMVLPRIPVLGMESCVIISTFSCITATWLRNVPAPLVPRPTDVNILRVVSPSLSAMRLAQCTDASREICRTR
jgi:hypothetical protein